MSKSSLAVIVASLLLLSEVFSGALRYYAEEAGAPWLAYVAKAFVIVAILLKLPRLVGRWEFWAWGLVLAVSSVISLGNGASPKNIAFAFFVYAPLLFGILWGRQVDAGSVTVGRVVWLSWLACLAGLMLDLVTEIPWKGYSYSLMGVDLQANREWTTGDVDRLGGFARLSSTLAMMICVFALYLHHQARSLFLRGVIACVSVAAIALTTTKSVLPAYLICLAASFLYARPLLANVGFALGVLTGVVLPFSAVIFRYAGFAQTQLLWSLDDRLLRTWPGFYSIVESAGALFHGVGFGAVGAPAVAFPLSKLAGNQLAGLGVADSTALYLWGMLGVMGVALYSSLFLIMSKLRAVPDRYASALLSITLSLCITSWTTDVLESAVASLFLGLAASCAFTFRSAAGRSNAAARSI